MKFGDEGGSYFEVVTAIKVEKCNKYFDSQLREKANKFHNIYLHLTALEISKRNLDTQQPIQNSEKTFFVNDLNSGQFQKRVNREMTCKIKKLQGFV